jgi:thiol:disulfide interchange protein DsbD
VKTTKQGTRVSPVAGALAVLVGIGAAFTACTPDQASRAQDVLPPQEVFRYEIETSGDEIRLAFDVRDGGYLYREKFGFGVDDPSVRLGAPRFPAGEIHSDEFFGEQEIYRHAFEIAIPYMRTAPADSVEFMLELQGCDDNIGLCYPPQDWPTTISLPPGPIAAGGLAGSLFAGAASDEPLPVDEAFIANPRFDSANELIVAWQIAPGYYLYRDKFTFDVDGEIQLGAARLPEGVAHTDQNFGDVEVYYDRVEIVVPFARAHPNEQFLAITAGFQGCKDESICYPPAEQLFELTLPASAEFPAREPDAAVAGGGVVAEQDVLADLVSNGALVALLGTFFVAGLGLALTPCVYPMIPILSSIIAGQGSQVSHGRSFALSVSYVLGMAVTYSVAGAVTALAGNQVQAVFQQPWIIVSVAGLFLVMALAMFGLFEIQMPAAIQSRISGAANRQKSGSFLGTAVIGALSALIVTTCVAPPLIAALIAIGQSGDVARGSLALFVLAIGMGTPLLLIGASAGKVLPKAGPWMNAVKAGFGVVMVGMAIWMLDRVLSSGVTLLLWALLVFMTGVFLGAFESLPPEPKPARRLAKGIGVLACLYGALMLIGWSLGGGDPLAPIPRGAAGFLGQPAEAEESLAFIEVETVAELETLLAQARDAGQPVMMDFTADWCVACKEMEEYTFPDARVVAALAPFMLLKADVTDNDDDDRALLAWFESYGPPTIAFFDRRGEQPSAYRRYGYVPAAEFADHVGALAAL